MERWLLAEFEATSLFALKISIATSTVGQTLILPTPYAIKMALVDAGFRAGWSDDDCASLLKRLVGLDVRIAPTPAAVVTQTIGKVRQERDGQYHSAVEYREVAHLQGPMLWAFDLADADEAMAGRLSELLVHINYIGRRGSFIRLIRTYGTDTLGPEFTCPLSETGASWAPPARAHLVPLDDFGPDANLETLSSFSREKAERGRHRKFVDTIVPIGIVSQGPGFTEFRR